MEPKALCCTVSWEGNACHWDLHPRGGSRGLKDPVIWLTADQSYSWPFQSLQWQFHPMSFLHLTGRIPVSWQTPRLTSARMMEHVSMSWTAISESKQKSHWVCYLVLSGDGFSLCKRRFLVQTKLKPGVNKVAKCIEETRAFVVCPHDIFLL